MYDFALSVSAFVRSNTQASLAWQISPSASDETLVLTPGGGRLGSLANGLLDTALADIANLKLTEGRVVTLTVGAFEASVSNYSEGDQLKFLLIPVAQFDPATWNLLLARESIAIVCKIENGDVKEINTFSSKNIEQADSQVAERFMSGQQGVVTTDDQVVTILIPKTKLVIAGAGPIADALEAVATTIGWNVRKETRNDIVAGFVADMSQMDGIVIMGHNVEQSARSLELALESDAGYIGALGSMKMQEARADWLAYRDVTDLSRVFGPAGLDLKANSPGEIAISIVAQMIAVLHSN